MIPASVPLPSRKAGGFLLLLATLLPVGLTAQTREGVVRGRVLTEEGARPVAAVEVRFRDGPAVMTNRRGEYHIRGLGPGWRDVAVITAACEMALGRVQVPSAGEWVTNLSLPEALAAGHSRVLPGEGEAILLTAADLDDRPAGSLADALRRELPELGIAAPTQPGQMGRVEGRNRATLTGSTTPLFILDGIQMGNDPRILWDIAPGDVAAVEIFRGAAGAWRYGGDASGGMIRIHTRGARGEGSGAGLPGSCPGPDWGSREGAS